jgi:hypothetical protein
VTFGLDLACLDDLDPAGTELDPESFESVVQEILHRLDMARGTLVSDDENAGLSLSDWSSRELTANELAALPGAIQAEMLKARPRVQAVAVTVNQLDGFSLRLSAVVTLASGKVFPLTVDVTKAGLALVGAT